MPYAFPILFFALSLCLWSCTPAAKKQDGGYSTRAVAQESRQGTQDRDLFGELLAMDSLLFQLGYNQCDTLQYYELVSQDFEFYHDQAGVTGSREAFLSGVGSLCRLPYKPRRALRLSSLQVYPLYENGVLYGAVQEGVHDFYAKEAGKPEYLTSTARFVHLWLREEGAWKLARVLSYDHQVPKDD